MGPDVPPPSRLPLNGQFTIDDTCIDCFLCQDLAPENFERNDEDEVHFVAEQPATDDELEAVVDALESCPTGSIRFMAAPSEE